MKGGHHPASSSGLYTVLEIWDWDLDLDSDSDILVTNFDEISLF